MTDATDDLEDQNIYSLKRRDLSTLMDYFWSLNIMNGDTLTPLEVLEIISDYLEKNEEKDEF